MASIKIQHGHKNLIFASLVANETGAEFEEEGNWITISDSPELTIPHYCFAEAFDPTRQRSTRGDVQLESAWRSLLLNKRGHLVRFDEHEILISDEKPRESRPQFLLRFPDPDAKAEAEAWAGRAGYPSLTDYILEAIGRFNTFWREKAE